MSEAAVLAPAEALERLLDAELAAARVADSETLLALQGKKRIVLRELELTDVPPADLQRLAARARRNLPLLRELVALHRALLGESGAPIYGPGGEMTTARPSSRLQRSG